MIESSQVVIAVGVLAASVMFSLWMDVSARRRVDRDFAQLKEAVDEADRLRATDPARADAVLLAAEARFAAATRPSRATFADYFYGKLKKLGEAAVRLITGGRVQSLNELVALAVGTLIFGSLLMLLVAITSRGH